ncbi:hypothetical protein CSHISOI_01094 [Colletotrichum shisoi]|uniref:Uncharacterized protein n=1 Tax=Colletotrichum shisoi TaxID=2078593 RepID=A0A5Q4C4W2_9PEZI|nr:hypothetical protein CSHISOI_01094 [Colletotrichum shisoi]
MPIIETRLSAPSFSPIEPNPPVVEALMRSPGSHTHSHTHTHTRTHFCLDGFIVAWRKKKQAEHHPPSRQ